MVHNYSPNIHRTSLVDLPRHLEHALLILLQAELQDLLEG